MDEALDTANGCECGLVCGVEPHRFGAGDCAGDSISPTGPASGASEIAAAVTGGTLHGHVKSGTVPLPGVTVTAQNTLTGKRYSTTTDLNGRVVADDSVEWAVCDSDAVCGVRGGRAGGGAERVEPRADGDFQLILASRAAQQQQREDAQAGQVPQAIRQMAAMERRA